jgi:3-oxoacyl-ACP reductase-like protein
VTAFALSLCAAFAANAQAPEGAPSPAATAPAPAAVEAPRVYLEKVTVAVDGTAEFAGSIQMDFAAVGTAGKTFEVRVLAKTGRKDIAKDLHKEITLAAGQGYKVKLSGDEIRISKASSKVQNFSIIVRKLDLTGVSVLVKKG